MIQKPALPHYALLILLALIWGSAFASIEIALDSFSPLILVTVRLIISALFLGIFAYLRGHRFPADMRSWRMMTVAGITGIAVPFSLISWAQSEIDSNLTAILMAFVPLSTLMLAHFTTKDEKMTGRKLAGLIVGLSGVITLIGGAALGDLGTAIWAQLAVIASTILYAISSLLIRAIHHLPNLVSTAGMMLVSAVFMIPLALYADPPFQMDVSFSSLLAVFYLGLFPSGIGFILMVYLIRNFGVTFMSLNNYLVPAVGVLLGALWLDETIGPRTLAGFALILAGIALTQFRKVRAPRVFSD